MQLTLTELVALLADEPTDANRDAFYQSLASSPVYFCPPMIPQGAEGVHVVQENELLLIPTVIGPNGEPMLLIFSDQGSLSFHHPNASYAGIDGRAALQIAMADDSGVIVQCMQHGQSSWAGVPFEHIAGLLTNPLS